jgi:hypothetical protein
MRGPKSGANFFLCGHNLSSKIKQVKNCAPDNGANNGANLLTDTVAAGDLVMLPHIVQHPQQGASSQRPALFR